MNQINSLLTMPMKCDSAVTLVSHVMTADGMRVVRSFDLQTACAAFSNNICPSHGENPCDCQMVVLLVYDEGSKPLSIVMHGHDRRTQLGLSEDWSQAPNEDLEQRVRALLSFENIRGLVKDFISDAA